MFGVTPHQSHQSVSAVVVRRAPTKHLVTETFISHSIRTRAEKVLLRLFWCSVFLSGFITASGCVEVDLAKTKSNSGIKERLTHWCVFNRKHFRSVDERKGTAWVLVKRWIRRCFGLVFTGHIKSLIFLLTKILSFFTFSSDFLNLTLNLIG